jgi:hypothetical protein
MPYAPEGATGVLKKYVWEIFLWTAENIRNLYLMNHPLLMSDLWFLTFC